MIRPMVKKFKCLKCGYTEKRRIESFMQTMERCKKCGERMKIVDNGVFDKLLSTLFDKNK